MARMWLCYICASFLVFAGRISQVVSKCDVPSTFWCDNDFVAKECGVLDQCVKYASSNFQKPIDLVLYYESMCPDCSDFFQNQLYDVYDKLGSIVNITLVPFGNALAYLDDDTQLYDFVCQHGSKECEGNLIETCAIALLKDISLYFPFLYCMETSTIKTPSMSAKYCAEENNIDLEPILTCSKSRYGNQLEHEMALKTEALTPKHTSVPWVTFNGVYTNRMQLLAVNRLFKFMCVTYLGPSKPEACL